MDDVCGESKQQVAILDDNNNIDMSATIDDIDNRIKNLEKLYHGLKIERMKNKDMNIKGIEKLIDDNLFDNQGMKKIEKKVIVILMYLVIDLHLWWNESLDLLMK
ncbi:hypothetical protein Tco_1253467 [Tanacetum coccineum]